MNHLVELAVLQTGSAYFTGTWASSWLIWTCRTEDCCGWVCRQNGRLAISETP